MTSVADSLAEIVVEGTVTPVIQNRPVRTDSFSKGLLSMNLL